MSDVLTPDLCVIGAGSGGLSVAAAGALLGASVVLIEKHKMGGDCLNTGCVPSKALLAAGKRARLMRDSARFGVHGGEPNVDFAAVNRHVHAVIDAIAPNDSVERFTALGVQVILDEGRFLDRQTVVAGGQTIRARRFVIATGSRASVPPIPGLGETPFLTHETIFDLTACPDHLIIIGGGPIGLEMAQAHRALGARVTVLEAAQPLAKDDPECAAVVLHQLRQEGIDIRAGVKIAAVAEEEDGIAVYLASDSNEPDRILGSHLLVAAGRAANVEGLGLDEAGVAFERRGITVDKGLRTTNRRVYAIGDVAGGLQFTHVANWHAGLVIRNALFALPVKAVPDAIPWVTYTTPELAHVGMSETAARAAGLDFRVLRWPFHDNDRAQAEGETEGFVKIITSKRGRVLGASIVGAHAGELITPWTLMVRQGLNIKAMSDIVVPYPTLSEAGKRAAISYFSASLTSPWLKRIINLVRRFG